MGYFFTIVDQFYYYTRVGSNCLNTLQYEYMYDLTETVCFKTKNKLCHVIFITDFTKQ